jgi:hypothetical protein
MAEDATPNPLPVLPHQYYHHGNVSKAKALRELTPGSVWNEAMRRAMVISIAGFFVPNLLANFGVIPQLHQSFQFIPGICGAAGVFLASMALFLGYFHHKLAQGAVAAIAGLSLPYFSTWLWFRVTNPTASAGLLQLFGPSVMVVAIGTYFALLRWHARLSNLAVDNLTEHVAADDYGKPKARWEKATYWVCMVIGVVAVVTLLYLGIVGRGR